MYEKDGVPFLMVTPQTNNIYEGVRIFEIQDLDSATLRRASGVPQTVLAFSGTAGTHNGAAGYAFEAAASGIIYSEAVLAAPLFFRIYSSRKNP